MKRNISTRVAKMFVNGDYKNIHTLSAGTQTRNHPGKLQPVADVVVDTNPHISAILLGVSYWCSSVV